MMESLQSLHAGEGQLELQIVSLEEQIVQEKIRRDEVEVSYNDC